MLLSSIALMFLLAIAIENCRIAFASLFENKSVAYITTVDSSCLCGHPQISFLCVHPAYHHRGIAS